MHSYSIETDERKNVMLCLSMISIVLSWVFYKILHDRQILLPWWMESPSVLFFYGLLFVIFDKWAWKIFERIGFLRTPNLNGKWTGESRSSFDEFLSGITANMEIFQTWTKIKIILTTEKSSSMSEMASITVSAPEGCYLIYQYINVPKPEAGKTMSIHRGTASLFFVKKDDSFTGDYYSGRDRQNYGSLNVKRSHSRLTN